MPYTHQVYKPSSEHFIIAHSRYTETPSGIIVVRPLGLTDVMTERFGDPAVFPPSLIQPTQQQVAHFSPTPIKQNDSSSEIFPFSEEECSTLGDFKAVGVRRIRAIGESMLGQISIGMEIFKSKYDTPMSDAEFETLMVMARESQSPLVADHDDEATYQTGMYM